MSTSDRMLWQRWQERRDPDAFAEIVSRHSGMVYGACKRILRNRADAEEVSQDCFVDLLNAHVEVRSSLAPWLHTVAVRRALNRAKSEVRRRWRERLSAEHRNPSTGVVLNDLLDHIDAAIASLPEKLRRPLVCHFLECQSYEQIAQDSGVAESTVRYRTDTAIERIRAFLKRRGIPMGATVLAGMLTENLAEATPRTLAEVLGKLAVAGTTASIAVKSSGATTITFKTIGELLMIKKLVAGVVVTAVIMAVVWMATGTANEKAPDVHQAENTLSQTESPPPEAKSEGNTEKSPTQPASESQVAPASSAAVTAAAGPRGIRIAGHVVDNAGQPSAGAHVVAQTKEFERKEATSSSDGTFEFYTDMVSNDLTLQAEKDPFESGMIGPSKLREPGIDGIVLALTVPRLGSIAGIVVDRSGAPFPGLLVNAHRAEGLFARQVEPVKTDSKGAFKLEGLAAGQYALVASFCGRSPETIAKAELSSGQALTGLRAVLDVGDLTIAGRVVDTAGEPIQGAMVQVHIGFGGDTSDENGHFEIKGLSEGAFPVAAVHEKYSWAHVPNVAAGTQNLEIILSGKAGIAGQVIQAGTGAAVTEFDVFHTNQVENDGPFVDGQHVTDAEGRFRLEDLEAGDTTVTVRAEGFSPASQIVTLPEFQTVAGLIFRLTPGNRIEGRVESVDGTPVTGACIYEGARAGWPDLDAYVAHSDAAGYFVVTCLSPGAKQISAYHPDYAPSAANVELGSQVRIVLEQSGMIEGTVTRAGAPFVGTSVMAMSPDDQGVPNITKTDGEGRYRLEGLLRGTVMVYANVERMRDGGALIKTIEVKPGETTNVDFEFTPKSGQVSGRVTIAGQAPAHAKVSVLSQDRTGFDPATTETSSDGSYEIDGATTGDVMLVVEATAPDGQSFARGLPLQLAEGQALRQDVDFSAGAALTGSVFPLRQNAALPFVYVFTEGNRPPEGADPTTLALHTTSAYSGAQCGADGTFTIPGLPPGRYTALALELPAMGGPSEARYSMTDITIDKDAPVNVEFDLGE